MSSSVPVSRKSSTRQPDPWRRLHQTELLELAQRRAQGVAIDAELCGELAFGG